MLALKSLVAGTMLSATLWNASDATAGCHGGHCHRVYRAPVYFYPPVVHLHHHGPGGPGGPGFDDDDHGGGPGGGPGIGGPGGNGQGGPNGQGQNGNGRTQNGNNTQAVQVPSGAQVTLTGNYGADGQVYLNINNVKLPLTVDQWTETGITLTLPPVQLTQAQSATIDVVAKNGKTDSIAITLNPQAKLVVNTRSQPANQGGGNANAGNVAGVQ